MASEVAFDDPRPTLCSLSHPSERLWTKPANCKGAPWRRWSSPALRHHPQVTSEPEIESKKEIHLCLLEQQKAQVI